MRESEKREHLNNFKNALLNVAPEYFGIRAIEGRIDISERAFAYELYHQLRLVYTGRIHYVNGELRKGLSFLPNYGRDDALIPDLVVHQHETTQEDIIAVEIKTNPQVTGPELIEDLQKLELYTRPGQGYLNYHIGILLVINSNFRQRLNNMRTENRERIIELLSYHRIGIWNIANAIPNIDSGSHVSLNPECLDIIRRDNVE
ncbi:MAG: hypothetical protein ACOCP4_02330 [Candidatus Woesearchaeota archaeon]